MMDRVIRLDDVRDVASNGDTPPTPDPAGSWQPSSLIELAANPPKPPTIGGLLYPAKRTVLSGETESMKTWLALILAKAELDLGLTVGWVDLDAMGPGAMLERLRLLGTDDQAIADRFLYYEPSDSLAGPTLDQICATVADRRIRLLVIDAFNPILNLQGLAPESTVDIETFWRTIADPICRAGAAPVLLDHVVKNAENRGKYAYGSERKASGAIVHIGFRTLDTLNRGGSGRSLLTVHKDRPGVLPRPTLGRLILDATGPQIAYKLERDKAHETGRFRPTILMERISRRLEQEPEPVAKSWVETNVEGATDALRIALNVLVDEGHVELQIGPRNAHLFTIRNPYREAEDNTPDSTPPDLASTSPHLAFDLRSLPDDDLASTSPFRGEEARSCRETKPTSPRPRLTPPSTVFGITGKAHEYDRIPYTYIDQLEPDPDTLDPGE